MNKLVTFLVCGFFTLNLFAQNTQPQLRYMHPRNESREVNPKTALIFGFDRALTNQQRNSFNVRLRSSQKEYPVSYALTEENKTLIVRPLEPFAAGEMIEVVIESDLLDPGMRSYRFEVTQNTWNREIRKFAADYPENSEYNLPRPKSVKEDEEPTFLNGVVVPSDYPHFEPSLIGETANGHLFLSNFYGSPYILILKNDATPYFYQKVEDTSIDFKLQPTGVLTRRLRDDVFGYVSMDMHYNILDTFLCDNGYFTDQHDIQLLENGHALLIASESRTIDMSALVPGGNPEATVVGEHIQEIDENGNSVFEFRSWDNFEILAAREIDFTAEEIDYVHANSIAVDYDGHLLMSSRNLSECTKINRQTGEIMWRLGGKYNQFDLVNETDTIDYQHDIRPVPGVPGNYTIFDNGNYRGYSRVVEYQIDTVAMTAAKVWEYRPQPSILDLSMGNAQRLPNGNTMINWADYEVPKAQEVSPEGEVVYEGNFVVPTPGYRTFRFEWEGYPTKPYMVLEDYNSEIRLLYNMFGADSIASYNIYGGTSREPEELIANTTEKWIDLSDFENAQTYHFRVTAVDSNGIESDFSNEDSVYIRRPEPGVNLIRNGDFSQDQEFWSFFLYGGAAETYVNDDEQLVFDINDAGTMEVSIQLRQNGIPLHQDLDYIFEFDAFADTDRDIVAKIGMDDYPYTNYSGIGITSLTITDTHYSYSFSMNQADDYNCRVVFNCGLNSANVTIDNVSLMIEEPEGMDPENIDQNAFHTYPNPVDQELNISFDSGFTGKILLSFYATDGRKLLQRECLIHDPDTDIISVDVGDLAPGIYICHIRFDSGAGESVNTFVEPIIKSHEK